MSLLTLLEKHQNEIVEKAYVEISTVKLKGYSKVGKERTKTKLTNLYKKVIECVKKKELIPMLNYTERIAKERFDNGFDLYEVQTAINTLEELIWKKIFCEIKPAKLAETLGMLSTILGSGKDNLARTYVALASKTKVTTLNLHNLFSGSESIAGNS
jgi:hypothetical protein